MDSQNQSVSEVQLVVFQVGQEFYGVDIKQVREIITARDITRVPRAPRFVEGIINLRGKVIPVVDLRKRFSLPAAEYTRATRIIVIEVEIKSNSEVVGVVVDSVSEVLRLQAKDIEPPSPIIIGVDMKYLLGVAKLEDKLVILLDLANVLTEQEKHELVESLSNEEVLT